MLIDCGAVVSSDDEADYDGEDIPEEHATLTTLPDGTKYQDYTYAVMVYQSDEYNLSEGGPTLTVEYDGVVKQTLDVPQYRPTGANINYDERDHYFFGCFRPQHGFVDTRGAGFYNDDDVIAGVTIYDAGLCKELLGWTAGTGFNSYVRSGSGDETYTTTPAPGLSCLNQCGVWAAGGGCQCDAVCVQFFDCCSDYSWRAENS